MTEEARQARNAYRRAWYRLNKEKQREYMARYWERRAAAGKEAAEERTPQNSDYLR